MTGCDIKPRVILCDIYIGHDAIICHFIIFAEELAEETQGRGRGRAGGRRAHGGGRVPEEEEEKVEEEVGGC